MQIFLITKSKGSFSQTRKYENQGELYKATELLLDYLFLWLGDIFG